MVDRSVSGYLHRCQSRELESILIYCLEQQDFDFYEPVAIMAIDILDRRYEEDADISENWQQKSKQYREKIKRAREEPPKIRRPRQTQWIV